MIILGISCFYHDSAACLIKNGEIIFASQEERYSRIKHDPAFPSMSIKSALIKLWISLSEVDYIVFYEKPFIKFERLLESYLCSSIWWISSFIKAIPIWLKEKLFLKRLLVQEFKKIDSIEIKNKLRFSEHHISHLSSAFFASPFSESAIITVDWVWEWTTTSIAHWNKNKLKIIEELNFPHSLGLLYSAFTYYLGFKVNSGEYKVMGLAPYWTPKYADIIKQKLIDIKPDGSFKLNLKYFSFVTGLKMINKKFENVFGHASRKSEAELLPFHMDIAASIQNVTEEIMLLLAKEAKKQTWSNNLCLAWWVALNCVANSKILESKIFEHIWIQPASWDAWWALWAALAYYYHELNQPRKPEDAMKWSYLWDEFSEEETINMLPEAKYIKLHDRLLYEIVAKQLSEWKVVWWFQWQSEFGPRSLGNRSILWDPRNPEMQKNMNLKIKFRESFRPFAPSVLKDKCKEYFDLNWDSPYMLLVAKVISNRQKKMSAKEQELFGIDKLNIQRSDIPAVTHIDYSARVQTVDKKTNPRYYNLISEFERLTWCPLLVNTSFNVRWEPIVLTPLDAYRCFMRTEMDILVIWNLVFSKSSQSRFEDSKWQQEFKLD